MNAAAERRLLQGAIAVASLVPLGAGLSGILESAAMLRGVEGPLPPDLDSHFRYLSGLLFGLGLGFLWCALRIEAPGAVFQALGFVVVCGGLARLLSLIAVGAPGPGHVFGLVMELGTVPALMVWQARVARRFARERKA